MMIKRRPETRRAAEDVLTEFDARMVRPVQEVRAALVYIANLKFSTPGGGQIVAEELRKLIAGIKDVMFSPEQVKSLHDGLEAMKKQVSFVARRGDL